MAVYSIATSNYLVGRLDPDKTDKGHFIDPAYHGLAPLRRTYRQFTDPSSAVVKNETKALGICALLSS